MTTTFEQDISREAEQPPRGIEPVSASALDRAQRLTSAVARLDQLLAGTARGGDAYGEVYELGACLQDVHEDILEALERVVVRTRFGSAGEASEFLRVCTGVDAVSLVEQERQLIGAVARWRLLATRGQDLVGDFRTRLVALLADRLRVQAELARDLLRDLELWRPTPYWTLRNVAGGDYPHAFRSWSLATRTACRLREQAVEALRELHLR